MKLFIPFLLFLLSISVLAKSDRTGKKLIVKKINAEIKLDGMIDSVWNTADSAVDFFQLSPNYDKKPTWQTVAKILTTNNALYCLFICYEDKKDIQPFTGTLDNTAGESVSLMLDSFDDRKTAYKFIVSVSGVRSDARILDDGRYKDYNWDGIWFATSKIYDWGWVAELKIPYKSIQFDEKLNFWGLDFERWIPSKAEDLFWNKYEKNEGQRVSKFGELSFLNFTPSDKSLNLEIYPVGLTKATYLQNDKYKIEPNAGLDIMFNPSPMLKFQLTANPDFAQIEADPYSFNISQYETYFNERRPFFTEGNEVFMAAGRESNTGFYSPLELFYSRRIGKKLADGSDVPLILGTKAFGRIGEWEYGGFLALTGQKNYMNDSVNETEEQAVFGSARIKKQFDENSSVGTLFVMKQTKDSTFGVVDIDGAFRNSGWQLSYQLARSIKNSLGDYASSIGFVSTGKNWWTLARNRYIGKNFDVEQIGYVPWIGTWQITALTGPNWFYDEGALNAMLILAGIYTNYKNVEGYTDRSAVFDFNMNFKSNWGYELTLLAGKAKDQGIKYDSFELDYNCWFNTSSKWDFSFWGGYSKTYNFNLNFVAPYSWFGTQLDWNASDILTLGTSYNMWAEWNPAGSLVDITYDARPYFSFTPINYLNIRFYIDNLYYSTSKQMEQFISGLLFSYNFLPKSWIYFAYNEVDNRSQQFDAAGNILPRKMHVAARAGVFKIKYLYYF
jgi:hypothetical protein